MSHIWGKIHSIAPAVCIKNKITTHFSLSDTVSVLSLWPVSYRIRRPTIFKTSNGIPYQSGCCFDLCFSGFPTIGNRFACRKRLQMWGECEESVKPEEGGAAPPLACLLLIGWLGWQQPDEPQGTVRLGPGQGHSRTFTSFVFAPHSLTPKFCST